MKKLTALLLLCLLWSSGCDNGGDNFVLTPVPSAPPTEASEPDPAPTQPPAPVQGSAFLRFANLSTETGPIRVQVDGDMVVASLAQEGFSDYIEIPAGGSTLRVVEANDNSFILNLRPNLMVDNFHTLTLFDSPEPQGVDYRLYADTDLQPEADRAKFRFFNATRDVGPVRVVAVRADTTTFQVAGLTAPGLGEVSNELDISDFSGVRTVELRDGNDTLVATFSGARAITPAMLAAFLNWTATQGVVSSFYLTGDAGDLSLVGVVDDPALGGQTIVGDQNP